LKTGELKGSVGSNPTPSATNPRSGFLRSQGDLVAREITRFLSSPRIRKIEKCFKTLLG
jgi:hypothetical protein